jgi:hypothetical protein
MATYVREGRSGVYRMGQQESVVDLGFSHFANRVRDFVVKIDATGRKRGRWTWQCVTTQMQRSPSPPAIGRNSKLRRFVQPPARRQTANCGRSVSPRAFLRLSRPLARHFGLR